MSPLSAYDFWLLDLDGTLVDVERQYTHEVMATVGERLGRSITTEQAETLWYGLGGARNDYLRRWNIDTDRFWEVFHDVEDPQARAAHTFLYEDATWVGDLDRPVGLVTHSQPYLTDAVLDRLEIRDWFDVVVCCSEELGWKPDPGPVRAAVRELDLPVPAADGGRRAGVDRGADRAGQPVGILVGDGPQDVGAAWNAGLDAAHVERHGHDRRGCCVLGDYRLSDLGELRTIARANVP